MPRVPRPYCLFVALALAACGSDPDEPVPDVLGPDLAADAGVDTGVDASPATCPDWRCSFPLQCDELIQMPGETSAAAGAEDGYYLAKPLYRHWVRRDVAMLLVYAACEVRRKFPGASPLALGDQSEADGNVPGTSTGELSNHSGHTMGRDTDVAYYQTDGENQLQIVCGDGSDTNEDEQPGTYNDGYFCTTDQNIVDWEKQVWFFAKLMESDKPRVFGIDRELAGDLADEIDRQYKAGAISVETVEKLDAKIVWGEPGGWTFQQHNVHLSFE